MVVHEGGDKMYKTEVRMAENVATDLKKHLFEEEMQGHKKSINQFIVESVVEKLEKEKNK